MATQLSSNLPWNLANNIWAQSLNPFLANPLNYPQQLKNVALIAGSNTINHGLGRLMQGWFITDINGVATIYRSGLLNDLTITLTASAPVTVSLGVF